VTGIIRSLEVHDPLLQHAEKLEKSQTDEELQVFGTDSNPRGHGPSLRVSYINIMIFIDIY
jgi:hypothetical protein